MKIEESVNQLLLTARIGDGHYEITKNRNGATLFYSSIDENYMCWKHNIISSKFKCGNVKKVDNSAGFNKNGIIYRFDTWVSEELLSYATKNRIDIITQLDYFGFMVYYFDDGSWHKNRKVMNLYCNSFNEEEVECLRQTIFRLFGGKLCSVYTDKKKDGRKYPYLYIPKVVVNSIIDCYKDYTTEKLPSMLYKLGLPSQTIESQQKC